jgi:hypothetical protein
MTETCSGEKEIKQLKVCYDDVIPVPLVYTRNRMKPSKIKYFFLD